MADPLAGLMRGSLVAIAAGLFAFVGPAMASPDWELVEMRQDLREISRELLEEPTSRNRTPQEIVEGLDWVMPEVVPSPVPAREAGPLAKIGWMDSRLALAPMHHIYGAKGAGPIMDALGRHGTEAIVVDGGVATLAQLRGYLTNRQWRYDLTEDLHTLRVPLVVGQDAVLRLTAGDRLALSREDGAFIVGLGRIEIIGAEVRGTAKPSEAHPRFKPFITSLGSAHIEDAWLANLGFGNSAKYSGLSFLAHPTFSQVERSVLHRSRLDDLVTVSIVGLGAPEIEGNRFFNMARNALLISRSANARIAGNVFSGPSPTNAVRVVHGSDNAEVFGNVVLEGARAGFLVSDGSDGVRIEENLIWRRNGGGVKLSGTRCGLVAGNLILDDKQKGVEVRSSADAVVRDNAIIGNRNAGVWVSANADRNVTYLYGNLIRENGSGISSAQGGEIALAANDLRNQFPRFLDGELTHQFRAIAADMAGDQPIVLSARGTRQAAMAAPDGCGFGQLRQ